MDRAIVKSGGIFGGLLGTSVIHCLSMGSGGRMLGHPSEVVPTVVPTATLVSRSRHLINLAHPALLQVHLGPQETLVLADLPGHAKVDIHAVRGPWGGRDCKARGQVGGALPLPENYITQDALETRTHPV